MTLSSEEEMYVRNLQLELEQEKLRSGTLQRDYSQSSQFSGQSYQDNLIQWQLDLSEELERIEHILRGDVIRHNNEGKEMWMEQTDDSLKPFNEYGVQLIMNIINFYLNRNTVLSNYSEEMIDWKIKDLGDEIADMIFMKYEKMGMDTMEKKKLYPMIVREILDTVHSAYLRALHGGERESLRTARHVTQAINPAGLGMPTKFSLTKPSTWVRN